MTDDDRLQRWVAASHGLAPIEQYAVVVAQGLGRLDCRLVDEDRHLLSRPRSEWDDIAINLQFSDQLVLSYLWVLGAYELVRTIDQRLRERTDLVDLELARLVTGMKRRLARLRIPLAKMEAASGFPDDSRIAYPALSLAHGTAWQLDQDVFVSRQELSDELLITLEAVRLLGGRDA